MAALCYQTDYATRPRATHPAALGNRIAAAVIAYGHTDGSLEERALRATRATTPVNEPLDRGRAGHGDGRPEPLAAARAGEAARPRTACRIPGKVQTFIGPHWGHVTPFALPASEAGMPIDPGPPPRLGDPATDAAFKQSAVDVIRHSSQLDPADGVTVDICPASLGNNTLGTNDGHGLRVNPVTGQPYAARRRPRAPTSPARWPSSGPTAPSRRRRPGHWNMIANAVSDAPGFERRIGGQGASCDRLEWDVKMYLALNGAVHDAAIAAWGLKGYYDSARPISMIRYMGGLGQSSDPAGPPTIPRACRSCPA